MALVIDACVAQHLGDRSEQQDRVAILAHARLRGVALAIVADGMGGHAGGALAAEQVVHTAKANLDHFTLAEDDPQQLLENSMVEAHTMIKASRFINEKDPHSTAVMMLLQPGRITWGHCGDSRLYQFRGQELLTRTVDHSYVEHLLARGKITPEQAERHPHRNLLLASLGGQEAPKISLQGTTDLQAGDAYLLCSDGLWAYFGEAELARLVAGNSARRACEILIEEVRLRARGVGDNVSVAIIKLNEQPEKKPTFPRFSA